MGGLTVKHKEDGGPERIEPVDSVQYDEGAARLTGFREGKPTLTWESGHAFVMNAAGKTVGVYNMRGKR
jgi:hypothetical protein